MAVCFDPVLGDMRMRDEPNGPPLSFKLDGEALEADGDGVVDIPSATTTRKGVVKLNASTNSTSQSEAATPSAVRSAYQLANTANISSAKTGSDNYFSGENWFGNKVSFEGEVGFRTIPHATSEGKCGLTFFNDYYAKDDEARDEILSGLKGRKDVIVTRFKGLGDRDAPDLADTTMNPETRRMARVTVEDAAAADELFSILLGSAVEPRKEYIIKHAKEVNNVDWHA